MNNLYKNNNLSQNLKYEKYAGIIKIINAFNLGINTTHDLAKYLNVSETFLKKAINYYRFKYGLYYEIDIYCIYFYPTLAVVLQYN